MRRELPEGGEVAALLFKYIAFLKKGGTPPETLVGAELYIKGAQCAYKIIHKEEMPIHRAERVFGGSGIKMREAVLEAQGPGSEIARGLQTTDCFLVSVRASFCNCSSQWQHDILDTRHGGRPEERVLLLDYSKRLIVDPYSTEKIALTISSFQRMGVVRVGKVLKLSFQP